MSAAPTAIVEIYRACPVCGGEGRRPCRCGGPTPPHLAPCTRCSGSGRVSCDVASLIGEVEGGRQMRAQHEAWAGALIAQLKSHDRPGTSCLCAACGLARELLGAPALIDWRAWNSRRETWLGEIIEGVGEIRQACDDWLQSVPDPSRDDLRHELIQRVFRITQDLRTSAPGAEQLADASP